jgi:ribosomal protein S18 acetylase RimI-like enzyme
MELQKRMIPFILLSREKQVNVNEQIRIATWEDEPKISAMMCLAFASDPMVRRLLPQPFNYLKASEKHPGLSTGPAFDHGFAYVLGDFFGAALWLPPGVDVDPKPVASNLEPNADQSILNDFGLLLEKADAYRPNEPHWYLSLIAVDPIHRGKGYGEELMSYSLDI